MHKGRDDLISPEEAEKGIRIISEELGIDEAKIHYPNVECNGLSIFDHNFEIFPAQLLFVNFNYEIKFINCKFGCFESFRLYKTESSFLIFENCQFEYICLENNSITQNIFEMNNKLYFFSCKFNGDIDIGKAIINNEIEFSNCIFNKDFRFDIKEYLSNIKIKNCIFNRQVFLNGCFKESVYFNNSYFREYADFHECEFEKVACFYGTTFDKAPNFSQVIFKGSLNLVNAKLNFDFEDLEKRIQEKCETYNQHFNNEQDKKPLENFANDFRDSFRIFKNALIKDNNLLDASNFHKVELYYKEVELEAILETQDKAKDKINKNENSKQPIEKIKMEKITIKKLQFILKNIINLLYFLLCNIIKYIIIIICNIVVSPIKFIKFMYYGIKKIYYFICNLLYIFFILFDSQGKEKFKRYIKYKTIKSKRLGKNMLDFTIWTNCLLLQIYRNTSDHHTNFVKILNFTVGMIVLYAVLSFIFNINISYVSAINIVSFYTFIIILLLFFYIHEERKIFRFYTLVIVVFVSAFLLFEYFYLGRFSALFLMSYFLVLIIFYTLFICRIKIIIFILRVFSYLILLLVIVLKPQLINPFVGIFASDKLFESRLERKLNDLDYSTTMNLAKISQKDFDLPKNYNISFTELNSAKSFIIANQNKLYVILSAILDGGNRRYFKIILSTLENNSSNLSNTIKDIDTQNTNYCIFATMQDFLKLNFNENLISKLGYCIPEKFAYLSIKPKNQEYEIFNSRENQDKLRNILSIINFDKNLKLTEIKEAINYDEILSGAIRSTSMVYSVILLLCIFSLQKTARKNSIVPN